MEFEKSADFAQRMDAQDALRGFREQFYIPEENGKPVHYFCGNSLGLQPKKTGTLIQQELEDWARFGVEGHFNAKNPWFSYHESLSAPLAKIVGAKPEEVIAMGSLTANLHFLMVSFYRPEKKRYKILCEENAFPSDRYALVSQAAFHGYSPEEALITVKARPGETRLRTEDILFTIEQHASELALVMIGGVNYFTGQAFDIEAITKAAHGVGAHAGFDLAHAAGNIPLSLHEWNVDFAAWCSYKYLNSGPGGVAGIFVHNNHGRNPDIPRFAGWWGNDPATRFLMRPDFHPANGAAGWQHSNAPVFTMAAHKVSLGIFEEAGMPALCEKSRRLTGYLEFLLGSITSPSRKPEIITPENPDERGCQLSLRFKENGKTLYEQLKKKGFIVDWREPDVIRIAPVPLYNRFEDVFKLAEAIQA